jgi:hypothetical protein
MVGFAQSDKMTELDKIQPKQFCSVLSDCGKLSARLLWRRDCSPTSPNVVFD